MGLAAFNRMRREQAAKKAALEKKEETKQEVKNLDKLTYKELRALAKQQGIDGYTKMNTEQLREALQPKEGE